MEDKKRKRTTLILLALLALLIGLLIPFTWRSFKAVKASLMQANSLANSTSETDSETISGSLMHGGWVPSSTPLPLKTATSTATIPPSPTATATNTTTIPPSPTATVTATIPPTPTLTATFTATYPPKATETLQTPSMPTVEITKTENPILTNTPPTNVPLGGTGTPESNETSTPIPSPIVTFAIAATEISTPTSTLVVIPPVTPTHTASSTPYPSPTHTATATASPTPTQTATATATPPPCLPCTATAQVTPATTLVLNDTEVPLTPAPSLPPTVGPGGNPTDYSIAGLVFGLIAIAAFFLYFSGKIVSKRDTN